MPLVCNASRRPAFVGVCRCGNAVCAEREQLALTAHLAPLMAQRMLAVSFLGMIEAIDQGAIGGVEVANLFD
jgi:hypothetical protein